MPPRRSPGWIEAHNLQSCALMRAELRVNSATKRAYAWSGASIVAALLAACSTEASAQAFPESSPPRPQPVGIYIDCKGITCDHDFLRTDISFVQHLRARHDADVHVLVTSQPTAEGGQEATVRFIGQKAFLGINDALRYVSGPGETDDHFRMRLSNTIKRGLVRYANETLAGEDLTIVHVPASATASTRDPWNRWTFATTMNGYVTGEEVVSTMSLGASLSAGRTTDAWKVNLSAQTQYDRTTFQVGDERIVRSIQRSHSINAFVAWSLGEHLSLGARASALASRFLNQALTVRLAPALEYNVFSYRESANRMLTFEYSVGGTSFNYEEETIFGRTSEKRLDHALLVSLNLTQPWGSVLVATEGSHYLDDFRQQRGTLFGSIDWNLARGLSLLTSVDLKRIRDQVFLAARGASEEEILLRQRQLETSYAYSASFGISYTFGSPFARIVSRRFGGSAGRMTVVQ